jgi:hypothetical protein
MYVECVTSFIEIGGNIYRSFLLSLLRLNITIVSNLAYKSLIF